MQRQIFESQVKARGKNGLLSISHPANGLKNFSWLSQNCGQAGSPLEAFCIAWKVFVLTFGYYLPTNNLSRNPPLPK